jgi:hypothetical protein
VSVGPDRKALWFAALFLLHALPFAVRPALIGGDEPHYALAAHSLAVDGDVELLEDYRSVEEGSPAAGRKIAGKRLIPHVRTREGRTVFAHPLGLPLLAAPLVAVLHALAPSAPPDIPLGLFGLAVTFLALLAGCDLLGREMSDRRLGALIAIGFYFSTPLWFYSRTFFTEPYTWALAVLAVWAFSRGFWTGGSLLLGFCFLLKETAALIVLPVLLYIAVRHGPRRAIRTALLPAVSFLLFCLKNRWLYGDWLVTAQPFGRGDFFEGLKGSLFDWRHGLVPFAPAVLLTLAGKRKNSRPVLSDPVVTAWLVFGLYLVATAAWSAWHGGSCYGPRLLVPALPALALPLARAWEARRESALFRIAFLGLLLLGFTIQWCAASDPFRAFWSVSLGDLLTGNVLSTAAGLLVGGAALLIFTRQRKQGRRGAPPPLWRVTE